MTATKDREVLPHFSTLSGTPSDVSTRLRRMTNQHVIAFAFEEGSEDNVSDLADVMSNMALLIGNVKNLHQQNQQKAYQALVEGLIPPVPMPRHKIVEAAMTARARKAVFEASDWLTAAEVAEMAGFSKTNPSAQPNKWKKDGAIFAVEQNRIDYFPAYALDPNTNYRPYKALAEVINVFGNKKDAWGLAYWFTSVNSFLGGLRPLDLLANESERVIAAAKDEVADLAGVAHA